MNEEFRELQAEAEKLKEKIWDFMDKHKLEFRVLRDSMNSTLDLIDELEFLHEKRL